MRRAFGAAMAVVLALVVGGCAPESAPEPEPAAAPTACATGYRAVAAWDMDFLAVGTGGRVTCLSVDGTETALTAPATVHLHDVVTENGTAWMVGDAGTVLAFDGKSFHDLSAANTANLYAVARYGDAWYIGGSGGTLYRGSGDGQWTRVSLPLHGDIVGLAAGESRMVGVTGTGETLATVDGQAFTTWDRNAETGDTVSFCRVECDSAGLTFWATGSRADGSPVVLTSTTGGIWTERELTYMDGEAYDPTGLSVFGLTAAGQQMMAACNGGRLLTLPDCLQCNKLQSVSDDAVTFSAAAYNGGKLAVVGEGFATAITDDEAARQYKVTAETARQYQQAGAVIVDVRDEADYAARHIAGSVCIPLAELEARLPQVVPDRETVVIFYCARGVRSQTAVERAWELEYYQVYSLGAIENWTYEWEPTEE